MNKFQIQTLLKMTSLLTHHYFALMEQVTIHSPLEVIHRCTEILFHPV